MYLPAVSGTTENATSAPDATSAAELSATSLMWKKSGGCPSRSMLLQIHQNREVQKALLLARVTTTPPVAQGDKLVIRSHACSRTQLNRVQGHILHEGSRDPWHWYSPDKPIGVHKLLHKPLLPRRCWVWLSLRHLSLHLHVTTTDMEHARCSTLNLYALLTQAQSLSYLRCKWQIMQHKRDVIICATAQILPLPCGCIHQYWRTSKIPILLLYMLNTAKYQIGQSVLPPVYMEAREVVNLRGSPLPSAHIGSDVELDGIALVQAAGPPLHIGPLEGNDLAFATVRIAGPPIRVCTSNEPTPTPIGLLRTK